jgi:hypothetical protein
MMAAVPEPVAAPGRVRVHRCGGWHGSSATCPCQLERTAVNQEARSSVPSSVEQVVASPGTAIDDSTLDRIGSRLGHDFSQVRVHSDEASGRSARDVAAVAYTIGQHVVLDPARVPAAGVGRDQVLTHELVHTLQNARSGARDTGGHDRISDPASPREREASSVAERGGRVAGGSSGSRAGATLHRQPDSSPTTPDVGLGLTLHEDGRLDVSVSGPKVPVVGNPAVGMRRNADGTWDVLFGGTKKTVTSAEIPGLLRSLAASPPGTKKTVRLPTCRQLLGVDGRPRTFADYRVNAILWPETMMLTEPLYDALVQTCQPKKDEVTPDVVPPMTLPPRLPPELQDLPESVLPEGEAYA